MKLSGKRIAILVENKYEDQELWYPFHRLREEGAEVSVIGPERAAYASKHGYPVQADLAIGSAVPDRFDAVVIPGGYAPDHMRRHPDMVAFVRQANEKGKIIAAICHAGWMLASARILRGRRVTGFFSIKDDLENAGATYEDRSVVRDGNLITSRTPDDLPDFCREIIGALSAVEAVR